MTKSARQKRRTPIQGAFYLKHRADCPAVARADGVTLRYLVPESTPTMGLQELELPSGLEMDWHTATGTQIVWQILQGAGLMNLGDTQFAVVPGDVILIPAEQRYRLVNKSEIALRLNQITTPALNPS